MKKIETAERLERVGEYYFSTKLREVRGLIAQGKPVINMGIGSPDLAPHASVVAALNEAMNDPSAHQYQSYQGLPELREAMAAFYAKHYKVVIDFQSEVLPLMGSKEGILHIAMAFLNPGDQVLIPNPGYPTYTSVANLVGAEVVLYNLTAANHWEPDFAALEDIDLSRVKMMWTGYPHMPTGAPGSLALFEKLVAFARKHQILLVNDNPYSFILNEKPISILQVDGAKDVAIELNSLSKTFNMAGWRVGMALGKADFIEAILKVKSNMDSGMFYGIQKGAIAALQLDLGWFVAQNAIYAERRAFVFELAHLLGCSFDTNAVGLFVWAKLPESVSSAEAFIDEILYHKNIFITPGTVFGSNGEGYIRFSLCVSTQKIQEAIQRFKHN
jgi:LL-diaminopimelate aminotransferase